MNGYSPSNVIYPHMYRTTKSVRPRSGYFILRALQSMSVSVLSGTKLRKPLKFGGFNSGVNIPMQSHGMAVN